MVLSTTGTDKFGSGFKIGAVGGVIFSDFVAAAAFFRRDRRLMVFSVPKLKNTKYFDLTPRQ